MTQKFTAKEIHFLKKRSEDAKIHPPQTYFSDLIHTPGVQYLAVEDRLTQVPEKEGLICAVIQVEADAKEEVKETGQGYIRGLFPLHPG